MKALRVINRRRLFLLYLLVVAAVVAENEPEEDFQGYMESLQEHQAEQNRVKEMYDKHEMWRQTTWAGWGVRQMQKIGNHFAPFFLAIEEAVSSEDEGPLQLLIMIILRSLLIIAFLASAYAVGQILSSVLGQEIVIEEEIVVEDEDEDIDKNDENNIREDNQRSTRRIARDKKTK